MLASGKNAKFSTRCKFDHFLDVPFLGVPFLDLPFSSVVGSSVNRRLRRSPHGTLTPRNQPHNSSAGTVRTPHVRLPHHARPEPPVACPCALNTTLTMHGARFSPGSRSITCGAPTHCRRTDGTATLPPVCCALPTHCPLRGGAGAASPRPIALVTPNPEPSVRVLTCS